MSEEPKLTKVVVVGQGYVGLPLAMRAVSVGMEVVGYDISEVRVSRLASGVSYIEDITDDEIGRAVKSGRYVATTQLKECSDFDVAIITVPTPLREGAPDLSFIEEAARGLAQNLREGATVILESTTYPGTTEELVVPILEKGSGLKAGTQFHVGYSPERIDPGNPTWNFHNTPKVVSGIDVDSRNAVDAFYSSLVEQTVVVSSTRVAEMTKLLENTFRHVNIALVNELSMFANQLGVNVWEAIDAASTKPFGFMSNDVNEHMPAHVTSRIIRLLNRERMAVNGSNILVLGIAYKKNTGDTRESPSIAVCASLESLGAHIRVADSWVPVDWVMPWERVELTIEQIEAADLVVVVTDHDDVDYEQVGQHARLVFDTRRRTTPSSTIEHL